MRFREFTAAGENVTASPCLSDRAHFSYALVAFSIYILLVVGPSALFTVRFYDNARRFVSNGSFSIIDNDRMTHRSKNTPCLFANFPLKITQQT